MGIDSVADHLAMVERLNDPINATGKMDESKFEKAPGQFLEGGDREGKKTSMAGVSILELPEYRLLPFSTRFEA